MSDELAKALDNLLHAVWEYDKEQPVQTRLQTKHDAMRAAVVEGKAALFRYRDRPRTLDGESAPEYVTREPSEPLDLSNPPNDWTAIDDRTDGIIDIQTGVLLRQMPDWYAVWHSDGKWYCGKNTNPPRFLPGFDSAYQAMKHASQTWRIS